VSRAARSAGMNHCPSQETLEQVLAGILTGPEEAAATRHVTVCAACRDGSTA